MYLGFVPLHISSQILFYKILLANINFLYQLRCFIIFIKLLLSPLNMLKGQLLKIFIEY